MWLPNLIILKFVPCFKFGELNEFDRSSMSRFKLLRKPHKRKGRRTLNSKIN